MIAAADASASIAASAEPLGARIFEGACASCHGGDSRLTPLALNTNLHAAAPTNAIQAIRHGVRPQAGLGEEMAMPAFAGTLDDVSTASLLRYLRARFAPERPSWSDVEAALR